MKKLIVLLAAAIALLSCGGGGGGGSDNDGSADDSPEVTNAFMFRADDPEENPILTAEVGEELWMFFCFCDPNADVGYATISLYYPTPNNTDPFYVENGFVDATEECECWYWSSWVITPPIGEYLITIEVRDDVGNWSPIYEIFPFVVTQTNQNFDYLTEEAPDTRLWKEK